VLKVGDEVDVYVLSVNPQEKKIALSIKRTQPEPWSRVATKYEIGQVVPATITQLANFGAFARIEDGIEGLIHVSELSDERVNHPREVVQEGQDVQVRIIRIDPQRRRIGLSLRRANDSGMNPALLGLPDDGGQAPQGSAPQEPSADSAPVEAAPTPAAPVDEPVVETPQVETDAGSAGAASGAMAQAFAAAQAQAQTEEPNHEPETTPAPAS
jgi:small subunit ribosomal protein S1